MNRLLRLGLLMILAALLAAAGCSQSPETAKGTDDSGSRTATFQGAAIHYLDQGSGPVPLIFIHGWACDHTFWRFQTGPLSREIRIIAVDLPGQGKSDAPEVDYTLAYFAGAVAAIMDQAHIERAVLAGHSMGAAVARTFALAHPERTAGIIIVDGAILTVPQDEEAQAAWQKRISAFQEMFTGPDGEENIREFLGTLHTQETTEAIRQEVEKKMMSTPRRVRLSAMKGLFDAKAWEPRPVEAPTLAIYAQSHDSPPDLEATLRVMFPDLEYVFWDGPGHFLMMERPGEVNKLILKFMSAHGLN